jgi:hypothetical protein
MATDRSRSYKLLGKSDVKFKVGDSVLLSTVNLNKHNLCMKMYPTFVGPFQVTEVINDVAYRLALPDTMKIQPVFHVSLLKAYVPSVHSKPPPPPVLRAGGYECVVEKILQHRDRKVGKSTKREYFVLWQGHGIENASWEPEANWKKMQKKELIHIGKKCRPTRWLQLQGRHGWHRADALQYCNI